MGLTEAKARETHDVVTTVMPFDSAVRAIIEGRTFGFCKLVVDRASCRILGCHVVGERAVEIAQLAAIAMTAQMPVDELARVAISFPTYAEVLVYAAVRAAVELGLPLSGQAEHVARVIILGRLSMSKVLILGATGSLGRHVTQQAIAANHEVSVLVRTPSKLPAEVREQVVVHQADLATTSAVGSGDHFPEPRCRHQYRRPGHRRAGLRGSGGRVVSGLEILAREGSAGLLVPRRRSLARPR